MGNGSSKLESSSSSDPDAEDSRGSRFKKRMHLRRFLRRRRGGDANGKGIRSHTKLGSVEDFAGIAVLTLISVMLWLFCYLSFRLSLDLSLCLILFVCL